MTEAAEVVDLSPIANELADLRKKTGLSRERVAAAVGMSAKSIERYENGENVSGERLRKLRHFYRATLDHQASLDSDVPRGTYADPDEEWRPNPALKGIIPERAYSTAIDYCRRLVRAGIERSKVEHMERLMIDTRYAKANSRRGRELPEEDWIILVDDVWDAIRETLALEGIRV